MNEKKLLYPLYRENPLFALLYTLEMFRFACECGCLSHKEYFAAAQVDFNFVSISRAVSFPLAKAQKLLQFTLSWRFER